MIGLSPSDLFLGEPSVEYVTYSYEEGFLNIMQIIMVVSIVALISMIVSFFIGIRKKDCVAIFITNIMVKTVAISIYQILYHLIYADNLFMVLLFFIATVVSEGLIYKKVLNYKKHSGMVVSIICNIAIVVIFILLSLGFKRTLIGIF